MVANTAAYAGAADLKMVARPRKLFGSKADNGTVLVIGGSEDFHGAPVLASNSAFNTLASLRIGTGYAFLCVPRAVINPVRSLSPNLIVRPLGNRHIGDSGSSPSMKLIDRSDSVVIGMGIGRKPSALGMSAKLISHAAKAGKIVVVDADAIYSVRRLGKLRKNVILTPQDREFSELHGTMPPRRSLEGRVDLAVSLANSTGACVLLKGHKTVVTDGKRVKIVSSRSSALATMGTGDVLSGMIGGFAATGNAAFESGVAGAYLHSRIGDLLHAEKGNHILAADVVDRIPSVLKRFDAESEG